MLLQGYKLKTCYDVVKFTIHCPSMKEDGVTPLCPGDMLPPPCGGHPVILAVGPVLCLHYLLLVVVDVDIVILRGIHNGHEIKGDTPDTSHRNCEHS